MVSARMGRRWAPFRFVVVALVIALAFVLLATTMAFARVDEFGGEYSYSARSRPYAAYTNVAPTARPFYGQYLER